VSELENSLTAVEFGEWAAFAADEPFGDLRADLRAGIVASTIARTMGGRASAKPTDYMPFLERAQQAERAAAPPVSRARALADQVNAAFLTASSRLPRHVVVRRTPSKAKG